MTRCSNCSASSPTLPEPSADDLRKWFVDEELVERLIDGLRKAGLDAPTAVGRDCYRGSPRQGVRQPVHGAFDRGAAVCQHERGQGAGVLQRRPRRRDHQPAGAGAGLKVIARTSAFAFRGKDEDVRRIAAGARRDARARRQRAAGRRTHPRHGAIDRGRRWRARVERAVRPRVARYLRRPGRDRGGHHRALRVKLSGEAPPPRYMPTLPAYEAYLKARHHLARGDARSRGTCAEAATSRPSSSIPAFAPGACGAGFLLAGRDDLRPCPAHEAVPAARAAVRARAADRRIASRGARAAGLFWRRSTTWTGTPPNVTSTLRWRDRPATL